MILPAGWTEIPDPVEDREPLRHFEALYRDAAGNESRVETATQDPSDAACLAAIADVTISIEAQGGKIVSKP